MRTQSPDTSPAVERVQITHIRVFSAARKFRQAQNPGHTRHLLQEDAKIVLPRIRRECENKGYKAW